VFVDETWIKTNMAPIRGWSEKGRRLKGYAPHGHWRTPTIPGSSSPACAPTDCAPHTSSTARATAAASKPGSSSFWSRHSGPATSSSSTISAATREGPSARPSAAPTPISGSCRPTHPTSTRSNRPSPRSNTGCATPKSVRSKIPGATSGASSTRSNPKSAETKSGAPDTVQPKTDKL